MMTAATVHEESTAAWSISVKAVGSEQEGQGRSAQERLRDFNVTVSPDDELSALYKKIETITGLKANQQRLIYRGRLIGVQQDAVTAAAATATDAPAHGVGTTQEQQHSETNNVSESNTCKPKSQKIKDIVGLADGQTIHLVKKRDTPQAERGDTERNSNHGLGSSAATTLGMGAVPATTAGNNNSGTASLLAALLGLGSLNDGGADDREPEAGASRIVRAGRYGNRRRMNYRLTEDDVRDVPDPGSAEPIRQSLMTLHTLLPHATNVGTTSDTEDQQQQQTPLDVERRWYRGQWIDVRDTVNQWLEATVVDVLYSKDIVPEDDEDDDADADQAKMAPAPRSAISQSPTIHPANDPAISAGDLEGRRRLLLEPCMEGDVGDLGGELAGFRKRATNDTVQILLIHYNGWPHRWDEWIRSDSERIRPFRVRTRHPSRSTHASPTPQSVFHDAPSTLIRNETEVHDRHALLPELGRIMTAVTALVSNAAASVEPATTVGAAQDAYPELPWVTNSRASSCVDELEQSECDMEEVPSAETSASVASVDNAAAPPIHAGLNRRELEALAPLLDRLGRALIDAAPHVASLASSLPEPGRANEHEEVPELDPVGEHPSTLGGLLSLLSRDRRRTATTSTQLGVSGDVSAMTPSEQTTTNSEAAMSIDPDYTDYATGLVNTFRGEVRAGPRRSTSQHNDDLSNVLGAYLSLGSDSENGDDGASQGLGRLLRGGNGGGIDIHIHAVVTSPGVTPGALGLATLGGSPPATAGNVFSQTRDRRNTGPLLRMHTPAMLLEDEDDNGIFSELYSENPTPVNPNQTPNEPDNRLRNALLSVEGRIADNGRSRHIPPRSDATSEGPNGTRTSGSSQLSRSRRNNAGSRSNSNRGVLGRFFRRSNTPGD